VLKGVVKLWEGTTEGREALLVAFKAAAVGSTVIYLNLINFLPQGGCLEVPV
jgi:hypothetical protein